MQRPSARRALQLAVSLTLVGGPAPLALAGITSTSNFQGPGDTLNSTANWTGGTPAVTRLSVIPATVDLSAKPTLYFGGGMTVGTFLFDNPNLTTLYSTQGSTAVNVGFADPTIDAIDVGASAAANLTIANNPAPGTGAATFILNSAGTNPTGSYAFSVAADKNLTLAVPIVNKGGTAPATAASIEKTGAGTLTLAATNNSFGGAGATVKVTGGTLSVSDDRALGNAANSVTLSGGTFQFANAAAGNYATGRNFSLAADSTVDVSLPNATNVYTINGTVSGAGTLTKTGTGELAFNNAANSFAGTVAVDAGNFRLVNPASMTGGTVQLNGAGSTLNLRNDTSASYGVDVEATQNNVQIWVDRNSQSPTSGTLAVGNLTLGPVTLTLTGNNSPTTSYAFQAAGMTLAGSGTLNVTKANATIAGPVTETGAGRKLTKTGTGTLTLTAASSYTGGTEVKAGTLAVNNSTGSATGTGVTQVDSGATLTTTLGGSVDAVSILTGGTISAAPGKTLTVTGDASLAGTATGDVRFLGSLDVASGAQYIGDYAVAPGKTLSGAGTLNGDVTVNGTLAPGNSPGTLTVNGDLTLAGQADMQLAGTATSQYDRVVGVQALTFGGDLAVSLLSFIPQQGDTFDLFDFATSSGTFAHLALPTLSGGLAWDTSSLYSTGAISVVTAVPLPASVWMGGATLGLLAAAQYLNRRRACPQATAH